MRIENDGRVRPIDIVSFGRYGEKDDKKFGTIIVELKIKAIDQQKQLYDYYHGIKKRYNCETICIYVTPKGNDPKEHSIVDLEGGMDYLPISYKDLCDGFKSNSYHLNSMEDLMLQDYYDLVQDMYVQNQDLKAIDLGRPFKEIYDQFLEDKLFYSSINESKTSISIKRKNSNIGIRIYDVDGIIRYAVYYDNTSAKPEDKDIMRLSSLVEYWFSSGKEIYHPADDLFEKIRENSFILSHNISCNNSGSLKGFVVDNTIIKIESGEILFEQRLEWLSKLFCYYDNHPYCQSETIANWIKKDLEILEKTSICGVK